MLCLRGLLDNALAGEVCVTSRRARNLECGPSPAASKTMRRPLPVRERLLARRSGGFVVGVGGAELSIGVGLVVGDAALRFGFPFLVLPAVAAKGGKRHRGEAILGDLEAARFADPVVAGVEALERVVDLLQLDALAVGKDDIDFAIALFGGEIVSIHALVLVAFAFGAHFRVDLAAQLRLYREQILTHVREKLFSARGGWFLRHRICGSSYD